MTYEAMAILSMTQTEFKAAKAALRVLMKNGISSDDAIKLLIDARIERIKMRAHREPRRYSDSA